MNRKNIRKEVQDFCADTGKNRLLTQGAGGNVSWKEAGVMYIKASGTWLIDANDKDIFVSIELQSLHKNINSGVFSTPENITNESNLRPSIETMMHAIMPHKIVVHLHVIDILAVLVRKEAKSIMRQVFGNKLNYVFIDYVKPGPNLAEAIYLGLKNKAVNIVFLKNHGVIIGGSSVVDVQEKLNFILYELGPYVTLTKLQGCQKTSEDVDGYSILDLPELNELACNTKLLNQVKENWALYPDHVVFLGNSPNVVVDFEQYKKAARSNFKYIIVKNYGVFVSNSALKSEICQLICYADVLLRQPYECELSLLTPKEINELINWDSEKYRLKHSK
ncbi:MAG: class II aldolase [Gammaproteobacteria bacterium]|nr:class II aldolase [Gammaproteobacteria bacterium]